MKKIIYTLSIAYLMCFNAINAQFTAGVDLSISSPDPLTITVEFTGNDNFIAIPFNNWNSPLFAMRWPIIPGVTTADQVASIALAGDGFPFTVDSSTPTGVDGGDGFYYQKFAAVVFNYNFNIMMGETKPVATITLNSNGDAAAVDFELVDGTNAWVTANSAEPTIPNAALGEKFDAFGTSSANVLPIRLDRFTASKKGTDVMLNWASSSEINGSHFEIERSQDLSSWSYIGTVEAVGESSTVQEYNFLDNKLPLSIRNDHKIFYYRLNMVDNDNNQEYSDVRVVRFDLDGEADFLVYPNPSINEVYVNLSSISEKTGAASMNIINMNGQLVKKVSLATSDDIRVDVSDISAGAYYFIVRHGAETYTQKIIKVD